MPFIILDGLLPANPIAALLSVDEHLPIRKDFIQRTKAVTPGLSPGLACCPAALVSYFMTFLTCQNIRPPYKCLVGCRLKCVVLTHEMRLGTFLTMQAASVQGHRRAVLGILTQGSAAPFTSVVFRTWLLHVTVYL